ncbi:hypothetical protein [Sphingomonas sp. HMP6]|uniref:hypothetical protein n=1 Tax=Sphingomonas sp. HMP6 TaxID=1517551 RepID=UPI001596CE63|nr:hypothetical protein [Sphingomonas sp. HMP6]BCA60688.1 hypothetical protein HMP06_3457 [Sphingomonas sp. HMP6]
MQTFSAIPKCYHFSSHAIIRMQQRSIPGYVVDLLLSLTECMWAGGDCYKHSFDADSWAEATRILGPGAAQLGRYRNAYVIVADNGTIVTAARQH